jgi:hypothetical protein
MRDRIGEVLSRLLSEKYDANIKVTFKEREDEQRRDHNRASRAGTNARKRNNEVKRQSNTN